MIFEKEAGPKASRVELGTVSVMDAVPKIECKMTDASHLQLTAFAEMA